MTDKAPGSPAFTFHDLLRIEHEGDRVEALYGQLFREEERLRSQAGQVEFVTTVRAIEQGLKPGDRMLDLGAGTGAYSLHFAAKGHPVCAVELAGRNVAVMRGRIREGMDIDLRQGSALDLSPYADASFDIVLLFGPLYHLQDAQDRAQCLREAKRVLKPDGRLFAAFIHHDMIPYTESMFNPAWFSGGSYDHETFRLEDFPFVFFTLSECRAMLEGAGFAIRRAIAADGLSELMADAINRMDADSYAQYLRWHLLRSEDPAFVGASNHLLFEAERA
ncbi:MAG: class I SAM-dependent methyltransferase [Clostridiales bacterium]|nr:class I SAM-dependent methyltransferase [Clostridiales bacterium]